ncbi:hypothetical protein GCM10009677_35170 [Sphaerisporangium rubeum]|uniref:Uncharacterized protein n=1 Tax=Sphaerisporangium rubeum TaxID=321317 RepID=A0A7X0IM25_9ACTN|nr:hypothetical protein [Sphaerisporangium rubeum]MBB6476232.1 hypothetical protein [Sphaerisporangium rubeum]
MNFCLSDLVPPLRWSDAAGFSQLRDLPGLPDAWWRSLPVTQVFAVIGPEALGELLTELALEHWPAAAVGDVLPALHVMDPEEADEPQVSIALDRVGSWHGLLALTGRELTDQPFIRPRPVLAALFTAVFTRMTAGAKTPAEKAPAENAQEERAPAALRAPAPAEREPLPVRRPALPKRQSRQSQAIDPGDPLGLAAARMAAAALEQRVFGDAVAGTPATSRPSMFTPPPRPERPARYEPSPTPPAPNAVPFPPQSPVSSPVPNGMPAPLAVPLPVPIPAPVPTSEPAPVPAQGEHDPDPLGTDRTHREPSPDPRDEPAPGPLGPDTPRAADERPGQESAGEPERTQPGDSTDAVPADHPADHLADTSDTADAAGAEPAGGTGADGEERDMVAIIDAAFADLDDKTWTVAQNHVFTDAPAAPEELAKLFAVPAEEIVALEHELRHRLAEWLESPDAAPYAQYLEKLPGTLGVAAPRSRLIAAAPWHTRELRSLDVPAWQFVLSTLPGYTVQEGWLVSEDVNDLRERTCALILDADRPPTVARALELVTTLGIHPEVAKEWLESVPQLRIQSPKPVPGQEGERQRQQEVAHSAPDGRLKDVSMTRRCFRHPDGLWWLRVDVAPEQINGGECPLPSGFAAYLGMAPGESRTVGSAAGEVTLSWQTRPVIESFGGLLTDMEATPGAHLFLTVAEDDEVLRTRLVPAASGDSDKGAMALRLAGHTSGGTESLEETIRVLATRIGMTGPVGLPDLMNRLRERGDRDLLSLMV